MPNDLLVQLAFDYGDLPTSVASALEEHAKAITKTQEQVRRISAEGVIAIGRELKAAQERLANHRVGTFQKWVKQRCGITPKSAYRAISAFDAFGYCDKLSQYFDASSLYLLSAESCPEEATAEALKLAADGQRITHKVAKELRAKYSEQDESAAEPPFDFIALLDGLFTYGRSLMKACPSEYHVALSQAFKQLSDEAVI
jgi:hypothetical protein